LFYQKSKQTAMKRFTTIFTLVAMLVFAGAKAQKVDETKVASTALTGSVEAENNKSIAYATISLMNAKDSSLVKTVITDSIGNYNFKSVATGNYFVRVSMMGYKEKTSSAFAVRANETIYVPALRLAVSRASLATVTVTAKKPFIERKIDKTVMNVENSAIAAGSTVMDVLEKAPGVMVDKDGNISMGGKSGVMVMIDGKPTYMSNADLAQLLKSMQSNQVESIELITNPSAKYDAAGNAGIINIKTKKSKTVGTNGTATVGTGYGNHTKVNAGVNLNYRNRKMNIFGNYNVSDEHTGRLIDINRVSKSNNQNTYFSQEQTDNRNYQNNSFKVGVDYFVNRKNTFGFLVTGYANNGKELSDNLTKIGSNAKVTDSSINVHRDNTGRYRNINYNINYKAVLDTTGQELSVDVDYSHNTSNSATNYDYSYLNNDGSAIKAAYFNRNITPSIINIKSIKADYVYPVSKILKVEAGIKSSNVSTNNNLQFDELNNGSWKNNSLRSNHFIYDETVHAAYVNANQQFTNTSVQVGLRAEKTLSTGNSITENKVVKRSYLDLFPSVFINQSLGQHTAAFSYSRRIDRPFYDQLNPFVYYLDEYTYQKGNPFLNPEYTQNFELTYMFKKKYSANFRYAFTSDIITDVILPDTARKSMYQTAKNLNNAHFFSLTVNAPFTITKWWNTNNIFTGFNNQYNEAQLEGQQLQANKTSFYLKSNHNFSFQKGLSAEVSADYRSSMVYGSFLLGSNYGVDLGLSKSILNQKASIKFSVSDAFNTRTLKVKSELPGVNYDIFQKHETRVFRLGFNIRFGGSSIKEARSRATGLESEQSRIKS
jgi:hypothetical protein